MRLNSNRFKILELSSFLLQDALTKPIRVIKQMSEMTH